MRHQRPDIGAASAMLVVIVALIVILGMAGTWLMVAQMQTKATVDSVEYENAFLSLESAVAMLVHDLNGGTVAFGTPGDWPYEGAEAGFDYTIDFEEVDPQGVYKVTAQVTSQAGRPGAPATRALEVVIVRTAAAASAIGIRAAITADGPVQTLGGFVADGRDFDINGNLQPAPNDFGTNGISSTQQILNGGNSHVGGNGLAPIRGGDPTVNEEEAKWSNNDEDQDGALDEELANGVDDDGDGLVDEDTDSFYPHPDAVLGLAPGTLRTAAKNSLVMIGANAYDMYFESENEWNAFLAANGGSAPGGKVIYLDFPTWGPSAALGDVMNDVPSILVHYYEGNPAAPTEDYLKSLHGEFKGLLIVEGVDKVNSDSGVLGALVSFSTTAQGNCFGNGNAFVRYSSEVLGNLPPTDPNALVHRIASWRETTDTTSVSPSTTGQPNFGGNVSSLQQGYQASPQSPEED